MGKDPCGGRSRWDWEYRGSSVHDYRQRRDRKGRRFLSANSQKVIRAQRIAFECALPIVYLVDSAGVFLPMQDEIFPDEDDFGRIFRNNSVISAAGIPP